MNLSSSHYYHSRPPPLNSHLPRLKPMTSSFLLLRPKRLTFPPSLSSLFSTTTPKPTSQPKTLNSYTISTPTFTKPNPAFAKPPIVPFQPKVANSVRLTGHVTAPLHVTTSPENGALWASTVLTSTANSLRVLIVFEGELAHVAKLHVKGGDCVFVSGSLRSDLSHVNCGEMEEARLQVKVDTLNFVEESFAMKKRSKDGSDERSFDQTG